MMKNETPLMPGKADYDTVELVKDRNASILQGILIN